VTVHTARRVVFMVAMATMVVAGRWLLLEADVPQVAAGTWASAGDLGATPDGTASASLADGRLVIAGGRTSEGTLVAQVGIYDPATQSWEDGGQLAMARAGHTATALRDGRVLFAGGRTENGVTFDVEIYNPTTKQSTHVGDLWAPRVNHAATELKNGLVLVVGGSDGSVVVDYVELFDPESGQTQSLVTRLIESREKATATTLLDGHVLIAGGRNETGTLATAEISIPAATASFRPVRCARRAAATSPCCSRITTRS
jgi:N-acetylneuraminic acid mutarotase